MKNNLFLPISIIFVGVKEKVNDGSLAGISGTPSFLINGRLVVGAQPYQVFEDAINQALK